MTTKYKIYSSRQDSWWDLMGLDLMVDGNIIIKIVSWFSMFYCSYIPGGGNGSPLQYPCVESPVDRGACRPWSIGSQSRTQMKGLSSHTHTLSYLGESPCFLGGAHYSGLPWGSAGKESACRAGDPGSVPGLGRSAGEGIGYPLQYAGLENSMDCQRVREDWVTHSAHTLKC